MTQTLTAAIITRNGAATLPRLIASVRPHVDELCVFLAGTSTDGTPETLAELARAPGAPIRIAGGEWKGYAAARNESFAMASSDYIARFDDDEIAEGAENLRDFLGAGVLYVRLVETWKNEAVSVSFQPRVVRRGIGVWRSPIHDYLELPDGVQKAAADPSRLRVVHAPVLAPGRHDHRKAVEALFASERTPDALFCMARFLVVDDQDFATAAPLLEELVAAPRTEMQRAAALALLADCRVGLDDHDGASAALEQRERVLMQLAREPIVVECQRLDQLHPITYDDPVWRHTAHAVFDGPTYRVERKEPSPTRDTWRTYLAAECD